MLIRKGKLKEVSITSGVLAAFMHKFSTPLGPVNENNCETSALVLCVPDVPILDLTLETGQIYLQNSWVSSVSLGRRSVGEINRPRLFFSNTYNPSQIITAWLPIRLYVTAAAGKRLLNWAVWMAINSWAYIRKVVTNSIKTDEMQVLWVSNLKLTESNRLDIHSAY